MSHEVSAFGLKEIAQISITVHDLEAAVSFYRDKLGMAFFDCGGVRLMLAVPEKPEYDHPSSILYYKVADIQEAYDELASRGVRFEAPPGLVAKLEDREIWMAFLRDVDENLLAVTSETPTN